MEKLKPQVQRSTAHANLAELLRHHSDKRGEVDKSKTSGVSLRHHLGKSISVGG
jgi:hypothetical protein